MGVDIKIRMGRKRLLVTGCGRSGTKYISLFLTKMGVQCGHEKIGKDGVAAWSLAVDSEAYHMHLRRRDYNFYTILHQVRNPLDVIKSSHTITASSWAYIEKFIPIQKNDSLTLSSIVSSIAYFFLSD